MSSIAIIIPCCDEQANLQHFMARLQTALAKLSVTYTVMLIDDGSLDDTWGVICKLTTESTLIDGLRLSRNFGKDAAICAGLDHVRADAVIIMDADGQHPPQMIEPMINAWLDGAEIVEARKQSRGPESFVYRFMTGFFYMFWSAMSKMDMHQVSDFMLLDRRVLQSWQHLRESQVFFRGLAVWMGFQRVVVWFDVGERISGKSRWSTFALFRLAVKAITSFSSAPLQLVTMVGATFLLIAFVLAGKILLEYFNDAGIPGFATVNLLILFSASCIMIALGIIGEYLARIYEEVKRRPRYLLREQVTKEKR